MRKTIKRLGAILASAAMSACLPSIAVSQTDPAPFILVDQFGYLPELKKRAVVRDPILGFDAARSFEPGARYAIVDVASGQVVFEGVPTAWKGGRVDDVSGDRVWWFDFSAVNRPGRYVVRDLERGVDSDVFEIGDTVYRPVLRDAFKSFYYQRAGFEKRRPFAAEGYEDKASHLGRGQDPQATRYDADGDRRTARDLRGGWYDAGDYNQYTSWTANYISSLLSSYRDNPAVWTDAMGIPESGNGIPDLLDEVKWGLDWLERMQNEDGSMLSVLGRAEGSPPFKATGPSRYGPANTSATVTAAGTFAQAAEAFAAHPRLAPLSAGYANRARKAWDWAERHPRVTFFNNSEEHGSQGLAAGQQEVDAKRLDKKRLIAATQLYGLTGDKALLSRIEKLYNAVGGITADTANGFEGDMGFTLLAFADRDSVPQRLKQRIRRDYAAALADWNGLGAVADRADAYGSYVDGYWWGSNGTKSRRGSVFAEAADLAGLTAAESRELMSAGAHYLHYLHGVNPMGLVYLTNMGHAGSERSVSTLYHAWFKDGSKEFDSLKTSRYGPAPGLLVGGPNDSYSRDDCCDDVCGGYGDAICRRPALVPPENQPPSKSYAEFNDSWPLNSWEVTENSLGYQSDYLRLLSRYVR